MLTGSSCPSSAFTPDHKTAPGACQATVRCSGRPGENVSTERIYYFEPHCTEFDAQVVEIVESDGATAIIVVS